MATRIIGKQLIWLGLVAQTTQGLSATASHRQELKIAQAHATPVADPELVDQPWFRMLHLGNSWDLGTGKGVIITACSPGYYLDEPELKTNLLNEYRFDLANRSNPLNVADGKYTFHGTASAAIMVGVLNGTGTNGIAYNAKLIPLQNFNYDPDLDDIGKEQATADCVTRSILNGKTDVLILLNQTAAGSSETAGETRAAIVKAIDSGITVVSSAGDASKELQTESEFDTGSIIVGALRQNGTTANFSNWGRRVNISAAGESVYTLGGPAGKMRYFGGTAASAAQVAAVIAIAIEANPRLSPRQIRNLLIETRVTNSGNSLVGGRIDAEAFVKKAAIFRSNPQSWSRRDVRHRKDLQNSPINMNTPPTL